VVPNIPFGRYPIKVVKDGFDSVNAPPAPIEFEIFGVSLSSYTQTAPGSGLYDLVFDTSRANTKTITINVNGTDYTRTADATSKVYINNVALSDAAHSYTASYAAECNGTVSGQLPIDFASPTTTINSPDAGAMQAADFTVDVTNADTGGSGLNQCFYRVSSDSIETLPWTGYDCATDPSITVGAAADCRDDGTNICQVEFYDTDIAGNIGVTVSRQFSITLPPPAPAPSILSISPDTGPVMTIVVITGNNFDPVPANNIVKFNGKVAEIASASSTQLVVIVPPPGPGSAVISAASGGTVDASPGATTGLVTVEIAGQESVGNPIFTVNPEPPLPSLMFPPGTINSDTEITIIPIYEESDAPLPMPANNEFLGGVKILPNGLTLNSPVLLTATLNKQITPYSDIPVNFYDDSASPPPTSYVDAGITIFIQPPGDFGYIPISHFSTYTWMQAMVSTGPWINLNGVAPPLFTSDVMNNININGGNFLQFINGNAGTFVRFGGNTNLGVCPPGGINANPSFIVGNQISVTVPVDANAYYTFPGFPGRVPIFVYDPTLPKKFAADVCNFLRTNDDQFFTVNPPRCNLIHPRRGRQDDVIEINGMNFSQIDGNNSITINGLAAPPPTSNQYFSLLVSAPAGGTSGNVIITSNGQTSAANAPYCTFNYESDKTAYMPAPASANAVTVNVDTKTESLPPATAGTTPVSAEFTPDSSFVLVANSDSNNVSVINAATKAKITDVPVDTNPVDVAVAPMFAGTCATNNCAYVTNKDSDTVKVINVESQTVAATINVGAAGCVKPYGVDVGPSGKLVYVSCYGSNFVKIIDATTNSVVGGDIWVGVNPTEVKVTPDGRYILVVNEFDRTVSVIDSATNNAIATINVGQKPRRIAVLPDSSKAYVTNQTDNTVSVINLSTLAVTSTISSGDFSLPDGLDVHPNGQVIFVANTGGSSAAVINTTSDSVTSPAITLSQTPTDVAVQPYILFGQPNITGTTPATPQSTGTSIVINGSNFDPEMWRNTVMFTQTNPPSAVPAQVTGATVGQLTVVIPSNANSGCLTVTIDNQVSNCLNFTITDPLPVIYNYDPPAALPGQTITINGANFDPTPLNNTVSFGGLNGVVNTASATQLTVTVPALAACGNYNLTVTTLAGTSAPVTFIYGYYLGRKEFIPSYGNAVLYPTWSHKGDKVAFISKKDNGGPGGLCDGHVNTCDDWNVYVLDNFNAGSLTWATATIVTNDAMKVRQVSGVSWNASDTLIGIHLDPEVSGSNFRMYYVKADGSTQDLARAGLEGAGYRMSAATSTKWIHTADMSGPAGTCANPFNDEVLLAEAGDPSAYGGSGSGFELFAYYDDGSYPNCFDANGVPHEELCFEKKIVDFSDPAERDNWVIFPKWSPDCNKIMLEFWADGWDNPGMGITEIDVSGTGFGKEGIKDFGFTPKTYADLISSSNYVFSCNGGCPNGQAWSSYWRNDSQNIISGIDVTDSMWFPCIAGENDVVGKCFQPGNINLRMFDTSVMPATATVTQIKTESFHEYVMTNCADSYDTADHYANCPRGAFTRNVYAYTSMGPKTNGALRFLYDWSPPPATCQIIE